MKPAGPAEDGIGEVGFCCCCCCCCCCCWLDSVSEDGVADDVAFGFSVLEENALFAALNILENMETEDLRACGVAAAAAGPGALVDAADSVACALS